MKEKIDNKFCKRCGVVKPVSDFYQKRQWRKPEIGRVYYRSICKVCWNAENLKYSRMSYHRNPEKRRVREALRGAVKRGKVQKQPCVVCGDKNTHGHHEDYTKRLEVIWLCRQHHEDLHHKRLILTK